MKNIKKLLLLGTFGLLVPCMSGCSSNEDVINLRILNAEDYINEEVIASFEEWEKEENGKNVHVVYDTFDTIESMLSSLETSKAVYDLICCSDYAVEKLMIQKKIEPFDFNLIPNYVDYCSPYLISVLEKLTAEVPQEDGSVSYVPMNDYSVGYMWGTLGVLYNPEKISEERNVPEDEIKYDLTHWDALWNSKYHLEMSIKDSMRDTYSVGIMYTFKDDIEKALTDSGYFDEGFNLLEDDEFDYYQAAVENYNPVVSEIFNRCDEDSTKKVQEQLINLRENVYGFECDSGKDDMVKGIVGMNLAWSGDAVYAIDRGQNEADNTIYYSVPRTGGNIWFDSWVMPKSDSLNYEEAHEFLNFVSDPESASLNMDEIGYTSFIGGQTIVDLIRDWYDPRSYEMYVYHEDEEDWEASDFVYDENDEKVFKDGTGIHENGDDYGSVDMRDSTYEAPCCVDEEGNPISTWAEYQEAFDLEWLVTDLSYMFEGTLDVSEYDYSFVKGNPDYNPYLFYNDELEEIEFNGETIYAGRQFYTQYPSKEMLPKLVVMRDFGKNNKYVLNLWENVKSNPLPIWGYITFGVFVFGLIGGVTYYFLLKRKRTQIKLKRKQASI